MDHHIHIVDPYYTKGQGPAITMSPRSLLEWQTFSPSMTSWIRIGILTACQMAQNMMMSEKCCPGGTLKDCKLLSFNYSLIYSMSHSASIYRKSVMCKTQWDMNTEKSCTTEYSKVAWFNVAQNLIQDTWHDAQGQEKRKRGTHTFLQATFAYTCICLLKIITVELITWSQTSYNAASTNRWNLHPKKGSFGLQELQDSAQFS